MCRNNVKTAVLLHNFDILIYDSLMNRKLNEQHLFEIEIFSNIINVFTINMFCK